MKMKFREFYHGYRLVAVIREDVLNANIPLILPCEITHYRDVMKEVIDF